MSTPGEPPEFVSPVRRTHTPNPILCGSFRDGLIIFFVCIPIHRVDVALRQHGILYDTILSRHRFIYIYIVIGGPGFSGMVPVVAKDTGIKTVNEAARALSSSGMGFF